MCISVPINMANQQILLINKRFAAEESKFRVEQYISHIRYLEGIKLALSQEEKDSASRHMGIVVHQNETEGDLVRAYEGLRRAREDAQSKHQDLLQHFPNA